MSAKSLLLTAGVSLAVAIAYDHYKSSGKSALRVSH